jgi:hypothetical protein
MSIKSGKGRRKKKEKQKQNRESAGFVCFACSVVSAGC